MSLEDGNIVISIVCIAFLMMSFSCLLCYLYIDSGVRLNSSSRSIIY